MIVLLPPMSIRHFRLPAFYPVLLALPWCIASPARAAIDPAHVAAEARWMVHADMHVLRESAIGKQAMKQAESARVETPGGKVGINWPRLLTTIGTVTAYGTSLGADVGTIDGTIIVHGAPELRKIVEGLLLQATISEPTAVAEITDLAFPAYAITPPAEKGQTAMKIVVAFPPEPVVLVSRTKAQILAAREVLRGSAPSLARAPATSLKKFLPNANGSYLFAASMVPTDQLFPADGPPARMLKMASSGSMAIGEKGPDTFVRAELAAPSGAMADKLAKIMQGFVAMFSLAETNDKQLAEFLDSATVNRNGDTVTLSLAYASAKLVGMLQATQQKPPEKPAGPRIAPIVVGTALAQWQAEPATVGEAAGPAALALRTIENVTLKNGTIITLGRNNNGGQNVRFDRVEIVPVNGGGSPLVFRSNFMRAAGNRGNLWQFTFPGADGAHTLKVSYVTDPDGKATCAVSVRHPAP